MPNELSLVSLVLCVATGVLFCILLFILAKRKITRFTLKTSRRAHETIGAGSPKELRQEILRRLELTKNIKFEPHLIHDRCEAKPDSLKDLGVTCNYKYRMLAVDAFSSIDVTLAKLSPGHQPRHPNMSVRGYLLSLHHKGPLLGASLKLMNAYADAYEHARHSPKEFGQDEYKAYIELLQQIISCLQSESPMMSTNSREKVDVEVFYTDGHQYASSVQTKAVTVASDSPKSPRVLYGLQTRLRGSASKQSSAGDQQALLGSISSARSSEGHSDHDDSSDRLIPPGTESNC